MDLHEYFGFKKQLVTLSKEAGKILSLKAATGEIVWTSDYIPDVQQIFVRKAFSREDEVSYQEIVAITDSSVLFLNSRTGKVVGQESLDKIKDAKFMLLNN